MPVSGDYESKGHRKELLRKAFEGLKICTTNEAITSIYVKDLSKGEEFMLSRGWRYYTHLNKQTVYLEMEGYIKHIGNKIGELNRPEKIYAYIGGLND